MALNFKTATPKKLLKAFKNAIDQGHIVTWSYDKDGDFTHTTTQWKNLAWFRPTIKEKESLILNIIKPKDKNITSEVYAIYHGRFIEAMLAHCDSIFTNAITSALPTSNDRL
jgi:hypothetical protein